MVKIVETDEKATLNTQLEGGVDGAVILLNRFTVQPGGCRTISKGISSDDQSDEAATWIHFSSVASGYCWQFDVL